MPVNLNASGKATPTGGALQTLHLLYHELSPERREYAYVLDTSSFAQHLALFAKLQTAPMRPIVTFDDGHLSDFTQALPLLDKHNLKAKFFITAGWTGTRPGYMGWGELRALLQAGHTIGAHGWSHTLLTHCTAPELHTELHNSRNLLEDKLGAAVTAMSFPGGRFDHRVLQACDDAGYTQMYTSVPRAEVDAHSRLVGRLNLRRDTSAMWLGQLLSPESKLLEKLYRQDRLKSAAKKMLGDRVYAAIWGLLNRQEAETP